MQYQSFNWNISKISYFVESSPIYQQSIYWYIKNWQNLWIPVQYIKLYAVPLPAFWHFIYQPSTTFASFPFHLKLWDNQEDDKLPIPISYWLQYQTTLRRFRWYPEPDSISLFLKLLNVSGCSTTWFFSVSFNFEAKLAAKIHGGGESFGRKLYESYNN